MRRYILAVLLLLPLVFAICGAAKAGCPEIAPIARAPSTGSPFAPSNKGVATLDTQTSDNVRITGGCIDVPNLQVNGFPVSPSASGGSTFIAATCDGSTDDSTVINAAIATASASGNGGVATTVLPAGTCIVASSLVQRSNVALVGQGRGKTIIKQADGVNTDVITTLNAASLFGSGSTGGEHDFLIADLTIDGNRTNNSTAGSCLLTYGYHFRVEHVTMTECRDYGWRTAWGAGGAFPMEGNFTDILILGTGKHGWWNDGPHDSVVTNLVVSGAGDLTDNTYYGIWVDANGADRFVGVHSYASNATNKAKYALWIDGNGSNFTAGNYEGAKTGNVYINANYTTFDGSNAYYQVLAGGTNITIAKAQNSVRGLIQPPNSGASKGVSFVGGVGNDPSNNLIDITTVSQTTCAVDFTNSGGNNTVRVRGYASSGPAYCGTPIASDTVDLHVDGGATTPDLVQLTGGGTWTSAIADAFYFASTAAGRNSVTIAAQNAQQGCIRLRELSTDKWLLCKNWDNRLVFFDQINSSAEAFAVSTTGNTTVGESGKTTTVNGLAATNAALTTPAINGGTIINLPSPSASGDAATKGYADSIATGIVTHASAAAATTANLTATASGTGVGKTLTNSGAMAAFAVDGYSASVNDRILVKDQTTQKDNGIYTVTTVGSGAVNWVLTRATDFDQATGAEVATGASIIIINGTANARTQWVETGQGPFTVDTTAVVFSAVASASSGTVNSGTTSQLGYYAANGTAISGLATANNGTLVTSAGGVPSISSTLPSAVQGNITGTGTLTSGTTGSGFTLALGTSTLTGVVPTANGGAGAINGVLAANGAGVVSQGTCGGLSDAQTGCTTVVGTAAVANTGTSGHGLPFLDGTNTWSGVQSFNSGDLALKGATSGTITLNAAATAGSNTITLPAGTTNFSATGGANQVVQQASAGGAFTVGQLGFSNLSGTATAAQLPTFAHTQSTVAAPTGTTSTTGVMMGLAGTITPIASGKVRFSVCGDMKNSTVGDGANVQLRTGTGAAPANAAALTGTTRGSLSKFIAATATGKARTCLIWTVTGLTLSTAVWIDVGLAAVTGGTATISDVDIIADEIP